MKTRSLFLNQGFMALTLDMMKAYDHVEWAYLQWIFEKIAFPQSLIRQIMQCVTSVSFEILINGQPSQSFMLTGN